MYSVRPARPEDVEALAAVERAAFDPERYGTMMMSARSFARHIGGRRNAVIVAVDEADRVVGYALGFVKAGSPYLRFVSLAVLPHHAGHGAGTLLFRAIEEFAAAHGYKGVRLEVREDNDRLLARYGRIGYRVFARVADYYPDGCAAIRLIREVA